MAPYDDGEKPTTSYRQVDDNMSPRHEEVERLTLHHPDDEEDYTTRSQAQEIYALNRSLARTNLYLKIIIGLFGAILAFWLIVHVSMSYKVYQGIGAPLQKTPVPPIRDVITYFREEKIYSRKPDPESDAAWDALLPDGRGFVYVPSYEKYDLPEGQSTPWGNIFSVALYHQIHCLAELRKFSWMFLDAIVDTDMEGQEKIRTMYERGVHLEHMNHCFDYLRQTIFCGGDMTMEWPRTEEDGTTRIAVDGWDIPHTCKDINAINRYMDENHFNMSMNSHIAPALPGKRSLSDPREWTSM